MYAANLPLLVSKKTISSNIASDDDDDSGRVFIFIYAHIL
jgi:hypothetical protein